MVLAGVYGGLRVLGIILEVRDRCSDPLPPRHFRWLSHQSRQPDQVVRRATEDEQPVHFLQASQLDLAQWAGLLQPPEALFDQPSAAQADGIAEPARGSAIQVAGAAFIVPGNMWRHVQFPRCADEVLRVVSLVGAYRDAARAARLLFGKHQQRRIRSQQPAAVLGKHRMVPCCVVHAKAHKPAEQQVVVDLFDQQPLRTE